MTTTALLATRVLGASAELESSCLARASYRRGRRLVLVFQNGRRYEYRGVPARVYLELVSDTSPGRYFNREIRDRYPVSEKPVRAWERRLYQLRRRITLVRSFPLNPTISWRRNPTPDISVPQSRVSDQKERQ